MIVGEVTFSSCGYNKPQQSQFQFSVLNKKTISIGAAILTGGKGRRLGYPKELLSLNGQRVIERILMVLRFFFREIHIISNYSIPPELSESVKIFNDLIPGCGPLGGIYTGLKMSSRDQVFFVGCDMPFLQPELIKEEITLAQTGKYDCVIPSGPDGIEPLHGIYSRSIIPQLEKTLFQKKLSINQFCSHLNAHYFHPAVEKRLSFFNINTMKDLAKARKLDQPFLKNFQADLDRYSIKGQIKN